MKYQMYNGNKEIECGEFFEYTYDEDGEHETVSSYADMTPKYEDDGIWLNR